MAASFLSLLLHVQGKKQTGNIHPLKGCVWPVEGGGVWASCLHIQYACSHILLFLTRLVPRHMLTHQTWRWAGITSQIICTADLNAVHRMLSNVAWLQPLPLIYHVSFLWHSQSNFPSIQRLWDCQRKLKFPLLEAMDQNSVCKVQDQMS